MGLSDRPAKLRVTTNRTMIRKTFDERGINYAAQLAYQNICDLYTILVWNTANNIKFYRMSSDMIPWASEYGVRNLPNIEQVAAMLRKCGDYATSVGQRLTFHPGPFNKLTSSNPSVTSNTIRDRTIHADILDLMGLSNTHYNKINIHVGATYKDKPWLLLNFLIIGILFPTMLSPALLWRTMISPLSTLLKNFIISFTSTPTFQLYLITIIIHFTMMVCLLLMHLLLPFLLGVM